MVRPPVVLTELRSSFLGADDGRFGGQVGPGAPGGQRPLAGVELLGEKLLELHADLDEVGRCGARDDDLEDVPLQVAVHKDLTGGRRQRSHYALFRN